MKAPDKTRVTIAIATAIFFIVSCATKGPIVGVKKRAYETEVYEATYEEGWEAAMTYLQDVGIMPTFTEKETGLIKAEVPFTERKWRAGMTALTVLLMPLFGLGLIFAPACTHKVRNKATYTAYVKSLDPDHVSIRLLAVTEDGKRIWTEENYPKIHMTIQEIINQRRFLKGTGTEIE